MVDLAQKFEHYRHRFREAMDARAYTNEGLAERMDAHSVTVSKLRGGKIKFDDEWRARAASALRLAEDVLFGTSPLPLPLPSDIYVSPRKAAKRPANDNIPLYGLAAGSLVGAHSLSTDMPETVACPESLRDAVGAYALVTTGESMVPRYMPGDRLYINPNQRVRPGDHVVVQIMLHDNSGTETYVKRYDADSGGDVHLWQYNPPARVTFKKKYIMHIHRVLTPNEISPS